MSLEFWLFVWQDARRSTINKIDIMDDLLNIFIDL